MTNHDLSQAREQLNLKLDEAVESDALDALRAIDDMEGDLAAHRRRAVRAAAGEHTWAEIGEALGVSRQAAHHKFAKEWAQEVKGELKSAHRAHKAALSEGDRAGAATQRDTRDALIAELKQASRAQRRRKRG